MESVRGKTSAEQSREHCLKIQADPNKLTLSWKRKKRQKDLRAKQKLVFSKDSEIIKAKWKYECEQKAAQGAAKKQAELQVD